MLTSGKFSITCPSTSNDDGMRKIKLSIKCTDSRIQFLTVYIDPHDFAMALTGLSDQEVMFELSKTDNIGKKKETKLLSITLTEEVLTTNNLSPYHRDELASYIKKNQEQWVEAGWELVPYLGSQNSFGRIKDGVLLNVSQYRYV